MRKEDKILCLDLGGTKLRAGIVSGGVLSCKKVFSTCTSRGREGIEQTLLAGLSAYESESFSGVAASSAGNIDPESGAVIYATDNLPGYTGFRLADFLSEKTELPCACVNDGCAAALGEYALSGRKDEIMLFLTLGTGVGGAFVKDGEILLGFDGMLGHMQLVRGGKKCNCGREGCAERYASGSAFRSLLREKGVPYGTPEEIWAAYARGERSVCECVNAWAQNVRAALEMYYAAVPFGRAVLGGGMSESGAYWIDLVRSDKFAVGLARAGDDAGLLGAYEYFRKRYADR